MYDKRTNVGQGEAEVEYIQDSQDAGQVSRQMAGSLQ